jgi:intermediate peptidase
MMSPVSVSDQRFRRAPFSVEVVKARGLFAIPELQQPSDFVRMASQAMANCDDLRGSLQSAEPCSTHSQAMDVLFRLDRISQSVCNVIDAAELARSVHANEAWREAAHRAFIILSDYIAQLNADPTLYQALATVTDNATVFSQLTEEEQRFAVLLRAEFERDGIHLPDKERDHVRQLQGQLTELETAFSHNLVHSKKNFVAQASLVQAVIPRHVLQAFGVNSVVRSAHGGEANGNDNDNEQLLLTSDPQILQTLIKYSPSPELRKQVYMESMTAVPENLIVLQNLARVRHELATALGFASYADRFLRDKMAGNQHTVHGFLKKLQQRTQPVYAKEMELLQEAKELVEQNSTIEPWDVSFYSSLLKAKNGFDINDVSPYLTLHNCLEGMKLLCDKLFGIKMEEDHMTVDERWDVGVSPPPDDIRVRRFVFSDETGRSLGIMFLDLHPREAKYGHAAHFTVRCGCLTGVQEHAEYQLPIVALVCNLSASSQTSMLSHSEVETLFHEYGHALHSLLSRTKFQHMSGTRAAMDFVETPSHLVENFVWDPQFLRVFALHHETGKAMPEQMIQQLRNSRNDFSAIERQNQITYALFDQKLFGRPDPSQPSTTEIFAKLHKDHNIPYAEGTHWHSRFGHLVTYGAGYYGYLYSQVFAGDIWQHCFEGDSLRRESGERLWQNMLIHGGAKDPSVMLTDLLGRPPKE